MRLFLPGVYPPLTAVALCLVILHSPDGRELRIESRQIVAVRPADTKLREHLGPGSKAIVYTPGQNFAVTEMIEEIQELVEECVGEQR